MPKQFPYPIGVGVDICRTHRVAFILRDERMRNRWARKVFTRLEWPSLVEKFDRVDRGNDGFLAVNLKKQSQPRLGEDPSEQDIWMLPKLSSLQTVHKEKKAYVSATRDERSPLGRLVHHLAGRWAAKEAAIKAHTRRRLYMNEISVIYQRSTGESNENLKGSVIALIDPVCDTIEMNEHVAWQRGLRGFRRSTEGYHKGALTEDPRIDDSDQSQETTELLGKFTRRAKVWDSDRRVAKISISHDSGYATAVCMASDLEHVRRAEYIIDDGTGLAKHEPQWGDEGWLRNMGQTTGALDQRKVGI